MFKVELAMKQVTTCIVKESYLEQFVKLIQDGGMLVFITSLDGEPIDVEEDLYNDEYVVTILKLSREYIDKLTCIGME